VRNSKSAKTCPIKRADRRNIGQCHVSSGANLIAKSVRQNALTINGTGTTTISASGNGDTHADASTSKVTSLTVAGGGTPTANLDLTNNLLAVGGGGNPALTRATAD